MARTSSITFHMFVSVGFLYLKCFSFFKFLFFSFVPVFDRSIIANHTGVDFAFFSALRALEVLTAQIAMLRADAESWCDRKIGKSEI